VVDNELEVARNFTWTVLGMEDGNFWHLGGVTRWNSQFLKYTWTFLAIICVVSQLFLCFFWISLWVKNRCLQQPCFKNLCKIALESLQKVRFQRPTLAFRICEHIHDVHSMLFALPGYQFPYTVVNRCLYLKWINEDLLASSPTTPSSLYWTQT
jgi:hypothetical protein